MPKIIPDSSEKAYGKPVKKRFFLDALFKPKF